MNYFYWYFDVKHLYGKSCFYIGASANNKSLNETIEDMAAKVIETLQSNNYKVIEVSLNKMEPVKSKTEIGMIKAYPEIVYKQY